MPKDPLRVTNGTCDVRPNAADHHILHQHEPKARKLDKGTFLGDNPKVKLEVGLTIFFIKNLHTQRIRTQLTESSILSTFKGYVTPVVEEN